jgi:hypothetical protein
VLKKPKLLDHISLKKLVLSWIEDPDMRHQPTFGVNFARDLLQLENSIKKREADKSATQARNIEEEKRLKTIRSGLLNGRFNDDSDDFDDAGGGDIDAVDDAAGAGAGAGGASAGASAGASPPTTSDDDFELSQPNDDDEVHVVVTSPKKSPCPRKKKKKRLSMAEVNLSVASVAHRLCHSGKC